MDPGGRMAVAGCGSGTTAKAAVQATAKVAQTTAATDVTQSDGTGAANTGTCYAGCGGGGAAAAPDLAEALRANGANLAGGAADPSATAGGPGMDLPGGAGGPT